MCFSLIDVIFKRRRRLYMTAKSRLSVIVVAPSLGTVLKVYGSPQLELKRADLQGVLLCVFGLNFTLDQKEICAVCQLGQAVL